VAVALASSVSRVASAEDPSATMHDLAEAGDFRLRVSAALVLGHTRPDGAREALEQALGDAHPAVRVAAARALASLSDPAALPSLERRLGQDSSASVTAQLRVTIAQLTNLRRASGADQTPDGPVRGLTPDGHLPPGVRYVVELGTMRNHSGIGGARGDELEQVLGDAARARAQTMRGTTFLDGNEALRQQASARHLPVLTLDGNVLQISETRIAGGTQVQARVEFAVRRGQTLRGTVSGTATTFGSGQELTEQGRRKLEKDAVEGAVQSALRGAEEGLLVAAR
jgi:hypothetical protein